MPGRSYPDRPFLAVSAAIFRNGDVLLVRRSGAVAPDVFTLPGGVVEKGETLAETLLREVGEETGLTVEPVGLAGYRDVIVHDTEKRVERHFVVLAFAARWISGEVRPNSEIAGFRWVRASELAGLATTEGLADIIAAASALMNRS